MPGAASCQRSGGRSARAAGQSWPRSSCTRGCWRCTPTPTAPTTTCPGRGVPPAAPSRERGTSFTRPRSSCCATRRGAACWRCPPAPASTSPASATSPATRTPSCRATLISSSSGESRGGGVRGGVGMSHPGSGASSPPLPGGFAPSAAALRSAPSPLPPAVYRERKTRNNKLP